MHPILEIISRYQAEIITAITGGGLGWLANFRHSRRLAKANADKALIDNYEQRIEQLHQTVKTCNDTEITHAERIRDLNHALDDKTGQIRNLTQKMWESQQEINRLNALLLQVTEERDRFRAWHCLRDDCRDPRGPKPPRKARPSASVQPPPET